ncbi:hypothetical protein XAP6984_1570002 [Xanthomonas phaseoli pv. phaseoli]|uniref:Uncharacterized protein n=1 Tax=Xanthomonas campestris pv. phaseoli TaxID=317013 RepID=A0ABY1TNL6_XANCH|nr:hypothetical protein XAP6984_1570002 [Xanthomonas phaseoli pv. phaseoli]
MKRQTPIDYLRSSLARSEQMLSVAQDIRAERNAEGPVSLQDRIAMATVVDDCQRFVSYYRRELAIAERRLSSGHRAYADRTTPPAPAPGASGAAGGGGLSSIGSHS